MKRIVTALVLVPIFVYTVVWAQPWVFWLAVAMVSSLCFREYSALVGLHHIQPPGLFGYAAGLVLLILPQPQFAFLVIVAVLALALSLRSRELAEALPFAGALVLGILYTYGAMRCAVELRSIDMYWLLFALSLNWVGDVAAFYVGRTIGRHKLAPRISPGKSWEGSIASVVAACLYAALYFPRLLPHVPLLEALAVAAIGNVSGQIGDLCESALKRGAGVKDSGNLLPGHGGWLDRVDSSLFALPVVYFLVSNLRFQP
jgi:phosphatidate cytidylyltransferase